MITSNTFAARRWWTLHQNCEVLLTMEDIDSEFGVVVTASEAYADQRRIGVFSRVSCGFVYPFGIIADTVSHE